MYVIKGWETGIRRMIDACKEYGVPELIEDSINNEVTLTLTMEKATSQNADVGINVGIKMTKTESLVLQLLVGKPDITSDEIAEQLKVTRRTVERNLESLKKKGIIERIGSKKDGYWKIIKTKENGLK